MMCSQMVQKNILPGLPSCGAAFYFHTIFFIFMIRSRVSKIILSASQKAAQPTVIALQRFDMCGGPGSATIFCVFIMIVSFAKSRSADGYCVATYDVAWGTWFYNDFLRVHQFCRRTFTQSKPFKLFERLTLFTITE